MTALPKFGLAPLMGNVPLHLGSVAIPFTVTVGTWTLSAVGLLEPPVVGRLELAEVGWLKLAAVG